LNRPGVIDEVKALAGPLADERGLELVEVEYQREQGGWVLRLYIDREGGVTLDDCQGMSRELSIVLDVKDLIGLSYSLEVSSPGLNRPLSGEKDFIRYKGELVRLKSKKALEGRRNFAGTLQGVKDGKVILIDSESCEWRIDMANIEKARLDVTIEAQ